MIFSLIFFICLSNSIADEQVLKLRPDVSECSDQKLFQRLDTNGPKIALASLPGK